MTTSFTTYTITELDGNEIVIHDEDDDIQTMECLKEQLARRLHEEKEKFELYDLRHKPKHNEKPRNELTLVVNPMKDEGRFFKYHWVFYADEPFKTTGDLLLFPFVAGKHGEGTLTMHRPNGDEWFTIKKCNFWALSQCTLDINNSKTWVSEWVFGTLEYPGGLTFEGSMRRVVHEENEDKSHRMLFVCGDFEHGEWRHSVHRMCISILDVQTPEMMKELVDRHLQQHDLDVPDTMHPAKKQRL